MKQQGHLLGGGWNSEQNDNSSNTWMHIITSCKKHFLFLKKSLAISVAVTYIKAMSSQ